MFIEVTTFNGGKILVNFMQVKAIMPDDMDDMLGSFLVFDSINEDTKESGGVTGLRVLEEPLELLDMIRSAQ